MKSGAESGWDYSSRWFSGSQDGPELLSVSTGDILPVDLNSFLARNAQIIAELYRRLERLDIARQYEDIRENLRTAIRYKRKEQKTSRKSRPQLEVLLTERTFNYTINFSER